MAVDADEADEEAKLDEVDFFNIPDLEPKVDVDPERMLLDLCIISKAFD